MRMNFRLGILAACLLAPAIAAADGEGWYLGYDLGRATASNQVLFSADSFNYNSGGIPYRGTPTGISHDQTSSAYRVEAGYWLDQYVGLQVNYADLGKNVTHGRDITFPAGPSCGLPCENLLDDSPSEKATGKGMSVMVAYPLPQGFSVLARYGRFWDRVVADSGFAPISGQGFGNTAIPSGFHTSVDGVASTYGLGVGWRFTTHWQLMLGWDEYTGLGGSFLGQYDVRLVSLGIEYHF